MEIKYVFVYSENALRHSTIRNRLLYHALAVNSTTIRKKRKQENGSVLCGCGSLCALAFRFSVVSGTDIYSGANGRRRFNVLGALLNAVTHELITVTNDTYINADHGFLGQRSLSKMCFSDSDGYQFGNRTCFSPSYSPNTNLIERLWKFERSSACTQNTIPSSVHSTKQLLIALAKLTPNTRWL